MSDTNKSKQNDAGRQPTQPTYRKGDGGLGVDYVRNQKEIGGHNKGNIGQTNKK